MTAIILLFLQLHPLISPVLNCQEMFLQFDLKCHLPKEYSLAQKDFLSKNQNNLWQNQAYSCFSGLAIFFSVKILFYYAQAECPTNLIYELLFQIIRKALTEEKQVSTKTSAADLVTETDHFVENLIISVLKEKFPSHR